MMCAELPAHVVVNAMVATVRARRAVKPDADVATSLLNSGFTFAALRQYLDAVNARLNEFSGGSL